MKDLINEIDSRIKSPFLGYFLFSFLGINWQQLFYLLIDNGGVLERIAHFNDGTTFWSLIVFPFIFACAYSLTYPWLQLVLMALIRKPTDFRNSLQAVSENNLLVKKQELEKSRSELLEVAEKELINRAKRDEELGGIENINIRKKLQSEIEDLRQKRDDMRGSIDNTEKPKNTFSPSIEEEEIIRMITSFDGKLTESDIRRNSSFSVVRTDYYLENLLENEFLRSEFDSYNEETTYHLTTKSKKLMVENGVAQ